MRKREMSYIDYGMTGKEVKYVNNICKNPNETEKIIIDAALKEINPYIAPYVKKHLTEKKSYEKLCGEEYIYFGKGDFYGECRYIVAAIKRWMILYGIWEM